MEPLLTRKAILVKKKLKKERKIAWVYSGKPRVGVVVVHEICATTTTNLNKTLIEWDNKNHLKYLVGVQ